jgi:hypothetical protein
MPSIWSVLYRNKKKPNDAETVLVTPDHADAAQHFIFVRYQTKITDAKECWCQW